MINRKDKFTTKKNDLKIIGKLSEEELEIFMETGELPEEIIDKMNKEGATNEIW